MASVEAVKQSVEDRLKASKRLRVYIALLRCFTPAIQRCPGTLASIPNPCDPSISKREWENAVYEKRLTWRRGDDVSGGGKVQMVPAASTVSVEWAFSGGPLCTLTPIPNSCLRGMLSAVLSAFFAVMNVQNCNGLEEGETWDHLSCPLVVRVVCKPTVQDWTQDMFQAVDGHDLAGVRWCLDQGQDPNCVMIDSVLCKAVEKDDVPIVQGSSDGPPAFKAV